MNGSAAISILFILVVSWSLKCSANKTDLVIATLERKSKYKGPTIGINLAKEVAKNSSDLKAFLDKYEITIQRHFTNVSFVVGKVYVHTLFLRCFTTVFSGPYPTFPLGHLADFQASDRCEIYTRDWTWIEV